MQMHRIALPKGRILRVLRQQNTKLPALLVEWRCGRLRNLHEQLIQDRRNNLCLMQQSFGALFFLPKRQQLYIVRGRLFFISV